MLQEIYNEVQAKMQQQIQEKFGLSADQTTQSTAVLLENFKKFFSEDLMAGGLNGIKDLLSHGLSDIKSNPVLNNLQNNVLNDLVNKVGLSDETAQKVRDFSLTQVFERFREEFMDENGRPNLSKMLSLVSMDGIRDKATQIADQMGIDIGKFFSK